MEEVIVRYIHFASTMLLSAMLILEYILLQSPLKVGAIKKLEKIDGIYAVAAFLTFGSGLFLWLVIGKPKPYYADNLLFQIKIALFILLICLSVLPTFFILKNTKNTTSAIVIPKHVRVIVRIELLVLLLILPLLSVLVAKGMGRY